MKSGTVKWFDAKKGFGFIVPSDGGPDVLAHYKNIVGQEGYRTLVQGQPVTYIESDSPKGKVARHITAAGVYKVGAA